MYKYEKENNWTDEDGKLLRREEINFDHVSDKIIKKRTNDRERSYVEIVANGPQQSNWYVRYPYTMPLIDLINCLKQHCRDHELSEFTTFYGIIVSYSISFCLIIKYLLSMYINKLYFVGFLQRCGSGFRSS